jgi:hypothetical protein
MNEHWSRKFLSDCEFANEKSKYIINNNNNCAGFRFFWD